MFLEIHKDHVMKKLTNSVQMTLRYAELSNQGIKHLNNVISYVKRGKLYWIVLFVKRKKVTPKGSKIGTFRYLQCLFSMYGSKSFNDAIWKSYLYIWIELSFTHYSGVLSLLLLILHWYILDLTSWSMSHLTL